MRRLNYIRAGLFTVALTAQAPAFAADPDAAPIRDPGAAFDKMTLSERLEYLGRQNKAFEQRRHTAERERVTFHPTSEQLVGNGERRVATIVEYRDSFVMYSQPYDAKAEDAMIRLGFRKVDRAEDVRPMTLYNGRLYRTVRVLDGVDTIKRNIGKEMTLTIRNTTAGAPILVDASVRH